MRQNSVTGKNELWKAYLAAPQLVHDAILLDLKRANLYRHWQTVASKEGFDLRHSKALLCNIFIKHLPETAPLFGLPVPGKSRTKPAPEDGTLSLFN